MAVTTVAVAGGTAAGIVAACTNQPLLLSQICPWYPAKGWGNQAEEKAENTESKEEVKAGKNPKSNVEAPAQYALALQHKRPQGQLLVT